MKLKNYFQLLFTAALWGSSFLMIKYALQELSEFDIALYRILLPAFVLNLIYREKISVEKEDYKYFIILGIIYMILPFFLFALAEKTITSALAGLINGSTPIFVALIAIIFYKEKVTHLQKILILTGFFGVIVLSLGEQSNLSGSTEGVLYALGASICYGVAINMVQPLLKKYTPVGALKILLRSASLFSLLLLGPFSTWSTPSLSISFFPLLLLGLGSSGFAFLSFYSLVDDVGAVLGSVTVNIMPIFSIIFGYFFLNEITSVLQLIGVSIVVISAFFFTRIKESR
ncbi:MAG: DMT family transporter [Candidatus Actinomarinales bacterium]|nr:MAG: DMT family transporter [Candidatus Actinomarinales bacterium]